ncbi:MULTISPECIES: hypothetical protein [unclassified Methanoculleus]|jgi:hypothetical protein|uniref:hypothetical protein n=1 Tax=unclassified Methanoculleus TaxID=2619537 RepID=UPI00316AD02F
MDILLVTSNLGLPESPSSNHICDRIECLRRYRDINVYGITESHPQMPCGIPIRVIESGVSGRCEALVLKTFNQFQKYHILGNNDVLALREFLREYRSRLFQKVKSDRIDKFGNWSLIPTYEKAIAETIRDDGFDLIYSTGGPATVHIAVARALEGTDLPWIAEIQDPLLFEDIEGPYMASKRDVDHLRLAEECLKKADAVVCLTEACAEYYKDRLGKTSVHSIYPGANIGRVPAREPKQTRQTSGKVNIFHGGTLAGDRNLHVLLEAIRDEDLSEKISLTLAGYIDEKVREQISSLPFVYYLGIVSRDEALCQITNSNVCLVVQNRSSISRYTIPSKFYEYISLSSPVLFLGYDNNEVRKNSSAYNFYYCDQRDLSEVSACLRQVVSDHHSESIKQPVNIDIAQATNQFVELCRKVSRLNAGSLSP